jgi:hypothetical protein
MTGDPGGELADRRRIGRSRILFGCVEDAPRSGEGLDRAPVKSCCRQRGLLDELSSSGKRHRQLHENLSGNFTVNLMFFIQLAAVVFSGYHKGQDEVSPFFGE